MYFLFLHGLAGNSKDWSKTIEFLEKKGHECLSIEIPYLTSNFSSLENLLDIIKPIIPNKFLSHNSCVVGNSLGGSLALKLGKNAKKIILVASHTTTSTEWIGRGINTLNKEISRIFYDEKKISIEKKKEYENIWLNITSSRKNFSRLKKIKEIIEKDNLNYLYYVYQSKIYAICGKEDKLSPIENFYSLKNNFDKLTIFEINECGHAIPLEKPLELSLLLDNLLKKD